MVNLEFAQELFMKLYEARNQSFGIDANAIYKKTISKMDDDFGDTISHFLKNGIAKKTNDKFTSDYFGMKITTEGVDLFVRNRFKFLM